MTSILTSRFAAVRAIAAGAAFLLFAAQAGQAQSTSTVFASGLRLVLGLGGLAVAARRNSAV